MRRALNRTRAAVALALTLTLGPALPGCEGAGGSAAGAADGAGGRTDAAAAPDRAEPCVPRCGGRECGDDGCGGACGSCFGRDGQPAPESCVEGRCCQPDCAGRACGGDGCGGSCGSCFGPDGAPDPGLCRDGACCRPDCAGRACGDDGCGGSCGRCGADETCTADGRCAAPCVPDCAGRCCGADGCGGTCADGCAAELAVCDPATCACERNYPVCAAAPGDPACPTLAPAPTTPAGLREFVRTNAAPLYCTASEGERRDFSGLLADVGDATVLMFGEVHGTAELGHVSADLFEALVRAGRVDAVALELGYDLTPAMEEWLATGHGPLVDVYGFPYFPPDFFGTTLLERARALRAEGFAVSACGVDSPMRLAAVNEELSALAEGLAPAAAALLAHGLPPAVEVWDALPTGYVATAAAYREHVLANEAEICADLAPERCERIRFLAGAFWIGAMHQSDLERLSGAQVEEFFARREELIYASFRRALGAGGPASEGVGAVYAHMGAAHTCTAVDGAYGTYVHVGGQLRHDFEPTRGRVWSTHPAWGAGSALRYGGVIYDEAPEPALVAGALAEATGREYGVALARPGLGCVTNPLETTLTTYGFVRYAACYDALVYVRQLTPERMYKATPHPAVRLLLARRDALR